MVNCPHRRGCRQQSKLEVFPWLTACLLHRSQVEFEVKSILAKPMRLATLSKLTNMRQPGESEYDDLFTGACTDVMVQTADFDSRDACH